MACSVIVFAPVVTGQLLSFVRKTRCEGGRAMAWHGDRDVMALTMCSDTVLILYFVPDLSMGG